MRLDAVLVDNKLITENRGTIMPIAQVTFDFGCRVEGREQILLPVRKRPKLMPEGQITAICRPLSGHFSEYHEDEKQIFCGLFEGHIAIVQDFLQAMCIVEGVKVPNQHIVLGQP